MGLKPYAVEGKITIEIDIEVEAENLEDAVHKAFKEFKEDNILLHYANIVDDDSGLMAIEFEDVNYDEDEDE